MDIRGAEKQITQLLTYLQEVSQQSNTMYSKSKRRLQTIATTCNQIVKIISNMLEDEFLEHDLGGMDDSSDVILQSIQSMQQSVDQLHQFIGSTIQTEASSPKNLKYEECLPSTRKILTPRECADAVKKYGEVSKLARAKYAGQNLRIINLLDALSLWIAMRFTQKHEFFRYNVYMIPKWVYGIVITYSSYVEAGKEDDFLYQFYRWCDSLTSSSATYAVPYEVNQLIHDENGYASTLTLTSLALWDILVDLGWKECCTITPDDIYPAEDGIYQLAAKYAPELLELYCDYKQDDAILYTCKLI